MSIFSLFQKFLFDYQGPFLNSDFFNSLPLSGVLLKVEGEKFIIINTTDAHCKLTGMAREDVIGKNVPDAYPTNSDDWEQLKTSFTKVIKTGEPDFMETMRYDLAESRSGELKERYWQVQNFLANVPGTNEGVYIWHFAVDKTAEILYERQKRVLETERLQRTELNRVFIKENSDGLYSLDKTGRFLSVNEGLLEITEASEEELLQMDFLPFCADHDRERILSYFLKTVEGRPQKFEGDFVSSRGREMILSIDLLPMKMDAQIVGAYGIAKDITRLRSSEKDLSKKKEFLELYSRLIDLLVAHGVDSKNLEYIFGEIGQTINADQIYYLGAALEDLKGNRLISETICWSRKPNKTHFVSINLSWYNKLKKIFGPFQYDTHKMFQPDSCYTEEQQAILKEKGIKSLLLLPVFLNNDLLGLVGVEYRTNEKMWDPEEKDFLKSLLKSVVSFVDKKKADLEIGKKEEELIRTEKKFEFLVQEGSDLIGILEADGTYKFVSASSDRVLGIPPKEFIGKNAFDFIHPEDKDFVFAQFSSINSQKHIQILPFRFQDGEGKWRWVETIATNLLDVAPIEGIITNSREITQEMERNKEIRDLNKRYKLAAKATHDLIYDWNLLTDEVTKFTDGKKLLYGYSLDEIEKRKFWKEHVHPEDREEWIKSLHASINNPNTDNISVQYRFKRSDGTYATIIDRGQIIRDDEGKAVRLIGATSDISEIISSKDAVKLANIRFNYAMKATREMIWDWNIKENIIQRSKAFKKLYGYDSNDSSVERFWFDKILLKDREKVKESLFAVLEDPKATKWKREYRFLKKTGEKAYVIDRGYIIRDAKGKAIRMVGATLDVSDSRRMIREIKKQNKVLREIAWEQAHVVRGPLTRLKGLVELVKNEVYDEWNHDELIDLISNSADELDDVVIKIIRKTEEI
ncbi:PAS domain-containing protein [Salegentibacter sediminis]|uniref:PAS domain-containing protein n=1 Tax=Salegentibacter sediminis TaxID=1930251 RepID=UPI0009C06FB4|nr:PAS domain-containing protein [Salegentibacter sediminis]